MNAAQHSTLWAASGAQHLTAFLGYPPGDPAARLATAAERIATVTEGKVRINGPEQLTKRATLSTLPSQPSPGYTLRRAGKMIHTCDGWVALQLPRDSDRELIPALTAGEVTVLEDPQTSAEAFVPIEQWAHHVSSAHVVERATLLGLACAAIPERPTPTDPRTSPWKVTGLEPVTFPTTLRVCDLSTLWAGPLAGSLLAHAGAQVTKLESISRPERPLPDDAAFTEYLNGAKDHVLLDFEDHELLRRTIADADIIITSARMRALSALGIRRRPGQIWLRITAYGADGPDAHRIGFGDDAAAAAGAVFWHEGRPHFCADALADPLTGVFGAQAVFELLAQGVGGTIDLSLFASATWAIADVQEPS